MDIVATVLSIIASILAISSLLTARSAKRDVQDIKNYFKRSTVTGDQTAAATINITADNVNLALQMPGAEQPPPVEGEQQGPALEAAE